MCLISILLVFKICCLKICVIEKSKYAFLLNFNNSFKCKIAKMFVQVVTENGQAMDRFIPCFDPATYEYLC